MEGAILLSRAIIDSEVFASEKLLKIWIWLLVRAAHKDHSFPIRIGQGQSIVKVKRGELIFGRLSAENELFIDGSTIYKGIKKLEALGNITIESNSHYSIITICNYDYYQNFKTYKVAAKEQPSSSQVAAGEQPSNTYKQVNNENYIPPDGWQDHEEVKEYIQKHFPKLLQMKKPLTHTEHLKLIAKHGKEEVKAIYYEMENWRGLLSKNDNAYYTANNWLNRRGKR